MEIERHRTALSRRALSRPVGRALSDDLITRETAVLDYGCGRGGDVERLQAMGIECRGFDPAYRPDTMLVRTNIVNLGYVINVIESPAERVATLRRAWGLAEELLIVSARLRSEGRESATSRCRDGVLTSTGTFQKFYTHGELQRFVEATLDTEAVAAAPGVFYVFRVAAAKHSFLLRRVKRVPARPKVSLELFERYRSVLAGLMAFVEARGRLPRAGEWAGEDAVIEALGSYRQAFQTIKRVTGEERWDRVRLERVEDLLVYLALGRFRERPQFSELPDQLRYDLRDMFGSYKAACAQADRLLFSVADRRRFAAAVEAAPAGKRTSTALYVHVDTVDRLAPMLRVREGCARALLGTVEGATLVKFHLDRAAVSYLDYPRFERDAHPALKCGYVVRLDSLEVTYRDYADYENPPILHRKELFLSKNHPLWGRFARLTAQEARAGLYGAPERIGTRQGWDETLASRGLEIVGHRLRRSREIGS